MKGKLFTAAMLMVAIMAFSAFNTPVVGHELSLVTGKTFLIYGGNDPSHSDFNGFYTNYTNAGNTVINGTDVETIDQLKAKLTDDVDVLLLPGNQFTSSDDLSFIKTWFEKGDKLLWVAGDSDYGSYFNASLLNPVLETVGSVLRLDAGAVSDDTSNDGADYRVVANTLGSGPIATELKEYVNDTVAPFRMPFHGPTAVFYMKDGAPADLRNANVDNVEVVISSSDKAKGIDQDLSATAFDYYASINATGNLPMLVVESMNTSSVIVSGEVNFADYKNMYGNVLEKAGTFHYGSIMVDALISFLFEEEATSEPAEGKTSPINILAPLAGLFAVVAIVRKRK